MRDKKQSHAHHWCTKNTGKEKKGNGRKTDGKSEKNAAIGQIKFLAKYFAVNFKNQTKQFI